MIDLRNHYGFTRTPFGKDLAPSMLCHYPAHAEAVARITWCARERALGVVTGEVGAGKTVSARAAIAALDQTRHTLIYLADPTTGTRGIHHQVVTALGGRPAHGTATLAAQAAALIAAEHSERGRVPLLVIDEAHLLQPRPARGRPDPDQLRDGRGQPAGLPADRPAHPAPDAPPRRAGRPGPADRPALRHARHDPRADQPATSPTTSSSPAGPTPCSATTPSR